MQIKITKATKFESEVFKKKYFLKILQRNLRRKNPDCYVDNVWDFIAHTAKWLLCSRVPRYQEVFADLYFGPCLLGLRMIFQRPRCRRFVGWCSCFVKFLSASKLIVKNLKLIDCLFFFQVVCFRYGKVRTLSSNSVLTALLYQCGQHPQWRSPKNVGSEAGILGECSTTSAASTSSIAQRKWTRGKRKPGIWAAWTATGYSKGFPAQAFLVAAMPVYVCVCVCVTVVREIEGWL